MGKYTAIQRPQIKPRSWQVHPIWRGIGCVLLLILPVMAFAGAQLLVQANFAQGWVLLPREFVRSVEMPLLGAVPHLGATAIATALLMLLGFGALTVVFAIFYRLIGPSRLGPLDMPPLRRSSRRRR